MSRSILEPLFVGQRPGPPPITVRNTLRLDDGVIPPRDPQLLPDSQQPPLPWTSILVALALLVILGTLARSRGFR